MGGVALTLRVPVTACGGVISPCSELWIPAVRSLGVVARAPGPSLAASAPPRAPGPESQRVLILFKPPTWQVLLWGHPGPHQNIPKTGSLWHLSDCKLAGSSAHPHALVRTESWDWVLPLLPSSSQLPLNSLSLHTQGPHLPRVTPLRVIGCEQMFTGNLGI